MLSHPIDQSRIQSSRAGERTIPDLSGTQSHEYERIQELLLALQLQSCLPGPERGVTPLFHESLLLVVPPLSVPPLSVPLPSSVLHEQ